jgi:hypothetical protein
VHQCTFEDGSLALREPACLVNGIGWDSRSVAQLAAGPWARDVKQWHVARGAGCSAAITAAAASKQGVVTVQ